MAGLRASLDADRAGALDLAIHGGRSASGEAAAWTDGDAGWQINGAGRRLAWGLRAGAFGLDYRQPFEYRGGGLTLAPRLATTIGGTTLTLQGDARRGAWKRSDTATLPSDSLVLSGDLSLGGGALMLGRRVGRLWLEAGAEAYRGALNGWFAGAAGAVRTEAAGVELELSGRSWSTPTGAETGFNASAAVHLGGRAQLRADVGRTVLDPLYGTPGSFGASVGFVVRLFSSRAVRRPVAQLGESEGDGRRALFRLHAPRANAVALAGDFTGWRPRSMVRRGEDWVLEVSVPRGVHHFAFLVDGREWTVPRDAPGVASDEWGRKNATLVVDS